MEITTEKTQRSWVPPVIEELGSVQDLTRRGSASGSDRTQNGCRSGTIC
ncbi:lasso RiPP family leader peptide-containing protein [Leptolyngbya sp. 7M]|nr:lasso RiPP family leader peptide-containing protein [Leptolyngbya sp. 7M]